MENPKPEQIVEMRSFAQKILKCGITKAQMWCAEQLYVNSLRTWQNWERGEAPMHPAFFELLSIKLQYHKQTAIFLRKCENG